MHMPWYTYGNQRTTSRSQFSLLPFGILGIKLRSPGLVTSPFALRAILLAQERPLYYNAFFFSVLKGWHVCVTSSSSCHGAAGEIGQGRHIYSLSAEKKLRRAKELGQGYGQCVVGLGLEPGSQGLMGSKFPLLQSLVFKM